LQRHDDAACGLGEFGSRVCGAASSIASNTVIGSRGQARSRKSSVIARCAVTIGSTSVPTSRTIEGTVVRRCSISVWNSWRPKSSAAFARTISERCEPMIEIASKVRAPAVCARSRSPGTIDFAGKP
jgi:hypothetical protein